MKLTAKQQEALDAIVAAYLMRTPIYYSNTSGRGTVHWKPADKLIRLGLIAKHGGAIEPTLHPTDAGLALHASRRAKAPA